MLSIFSSTFFLFFEYIDQKDALHSESAGALFTKETLFCQNQSTSLWYQTRRIYDYCMPNASPYLLQTCELSPTIDFHSFVWFVVSFMALVAIWTIAIRYVTFKPRSLIMGLLAMCVFDGIFFLYLQIRKAKQTCLVREYSVWEPNTCFFRFTTVPSDVWSLLTNATHKCDITMTTLLGQSVAHVPLQPTDLFEERFGRVQHSHDVIRIVILCIQGTVFFLVCSAFWKNRF